MFIKKILILILATSPLMYAGNEKDLWKFQRTFSCQNCDLSGMDLSPIFAKAYEKACETDAEGNRPKNKAVKIDLSGTDLRGSYLGKSIGKHESYTYGDTYVHTNLSKANLSNNNFNGISARAVNLEGANLSGCNLDHADLTKAQIGSANFDNSSLFVTSFENAQGAETAKFDKARCYYSANFRGTPLHSMRHRLVSVFRGALFFIPILG